MVVNEQGELPLPWLQAEVVRALPRLRGHAILLHADPGDGALEFALTLAAAWLCEAGNGLQPPCGRCRGCRLLRARMHPDLHLLMPEVERREHGWAISGDRSDDGDSDEGKGKRKASRQIRIDEVRQALDWIVTTPARSQRKVLLLHPATALNLHASNALLKTLEEPPASARLLLTASQPALLLPTIRSRCQAYHMGAPEASRALAWLSAAGVDDAAALLAAADGHPLLARRWHADGLTSSAWQRWPAALVEGRPDGLSGMGLPMLLHALRCLCHDLLCRAAGAPSRYFAEDALRAVAPIDAAELVAWQQELLTLSRQQEHPWSEALMLESLQVSARRLLAPSAKAPGAGMGSPARPLATLRP